MKKTILVIFLYILQCYCVVDGKELFGRDGNPFVLFVVSLAIPALFLFKYKKAATINIYISGSDKFSIPGFLIGCLPLLLLTGFINTMFREFPDPGSSSDVIPQLDALYTRWASGKFPYYPLEQFAWHPYPVYMPLNWLPLAIPHYLNVDVRWIGIGLLLIANGFWGSYIWGTGASKGYKITAIGLPAAAILAFILLRRFDISVTAEPIIAAYYLVLATGLASKNIYMTAAGIMLCVLSRYTLVFWLPLFAVLLLMNRPLKTSIFVWGAVALAVLSIYVVPFYLKDPAILSKGIAYHNSCAVSEWSFYPENSWTFMPGIYFAPYILKLTSGSMEHRVFIARTIQAILMLAICLGGIALYRRMKDRINFFEFGLPFLYLVVLVFYMFSPLLYTYYYIVLLCISAVLCGRILITGSIDTSRASNNYLK